MANIRTAIDSQFKLIEKLKSDRQTYADNDCLVDLVSSFDRAIQLANEKLNQLKLDYDASRLQFDVVISGSGVNETIKFYDQVSGLSKYITKNGRFLVSINDYDISAISEGGIVRYNDGIKEFVYDGEFRVTSRYDYYILVNGIHKLFQKYTSSLVQLMNNPILKNLETYQLDVIQNDNVVANFVIDNGTIRFGGKTICDASIFAEQELVQVVEKSISMNIKISPMNTIYTINGDFNLQRFINHLHGICGNESVDCGQFEITSGNILMMVNDKTYVGRNVFRYSDTKKKLWIMNNVIKSLEKIGNIISITID